jgi:hypothetical protein
MPQLRARANKTASPTHPREPDANRNRSVRNFAPVWAILFGRVGFSLAQTPDPALVQGLALLEEGRTTLQEKPLAEARTYFEQLTQKDGNNALCFYELARVDRYRVEAYTDRKDKRTKGKPGARWTRRWRGPARDYAKRQVGRRPQLAGRSPWPEDWLGGFMLGARLGPKIDAENKKAVSLKPKNPRVFASLGRSICTRPKCSAVMSIRPSTTFAHQPSSTRNLTRPSFGWLSLIARKETRPAPTKPCSKRSASIQAASSPGTRRPTSKHHLSD